MQDNNLPQPAIPSGLFAGMTFSDISTALFLLGLVLFMSTNGPGSESFTVAAVAALFRADGVRARWREALGRMLLVALVYVVIAGLYAYSIKAGLRDSGYMMRGLMLSLPAAHLLACRPRMLSVLLSLVAAGSALWAATVLAAHINHHGWTMTIQHMDGLDWSVNRNRLAVGFAIAFILAGASALAAEGLMWRVISGVAMVVLGAVSLVNGSRGALVGMAAAAMVMFFLARWRWALLVSVFGVFLLMLLLWHGLPVGLLEHNGSVDNGRSALWGAISQRIAERPWFGHGLHPMPYDIELSRLHPEITVTHAHSIYFEMLYDTGVFGALFWITWFSLLCIKANRYFITTSLLPRVVGGGLAVYVLVHGLVDFTFYSIYVGGVLGAGLFLLSAKRVTVKEGEVVT
jgi:O-antigen ligase